MRTKGPARDLKKEARWRKWIAEAQRSGETIREFCARRRLDEGLFYAWRRELRVRDTKGKRAAGFVELLRPSGTPGGGGVILRVGEHLRIEVERGFDVETLQATLRAVGVSAES
jgi:hypothetical protein